MKTNDLLSFFQSKQSAGTSRTFPLHNSDGLVAQIWVFSPSAENLSRLANATASTEEEFRSLLKDLQRMVQPYGGIVFYAYDHNGMTRINTYVAEAKGYALPKQLLRLSPAGEPKFENITDPIDLEVGDHLIVPISKDAEARLKDFHQNVDGLPRDLQSSVYNAIRRPSLEWRIDRIERKLLLPPATQIEWQRSSAGKKTHLDRLYGLVMQQIPIGPAAFVALALMAGTLYTHDKVKERYEKSLSKSSIVTQTSDAPSVPDPVSREGDQDAYPSEANDTKPALDALFTALKGSQSKTLQDLYASHFQNHQEEPFGDSSPVFWGIAKLEALRLRLIEDRNPILKEVDLNAPVKAIYRSRAGRKELQDATVLNLLAWGSCRQFRRAEMPETETVPKEAFSLQTGHACDQWKAEDVVPGLKALTDWVNTQGRKATK